MRGYLAILWIAALTAPALSQLSTDPKETISNCMRKIKLYLYTKTHPQSYYLELDKIEESFRNSSIDFKKQTKFISYPHELQRTDLNFTEIIQKMIHKLDANVIVIEWPLVSKREVTMKEAASSPLFFEGVCIGRLLSRLGTMRVDPTKFHLMAYGEKVPVFVMAAKLAYPFVPGRLTGFQPVYDNITVSFLQLDRPSEQSINFVDMIYTSISRSENVINYGQVAFYPNEGTHPQPGVHPTYRDVSSIRGLRYFVESIDRPDMFVAKKCESWAKYVANECSSNESNKLGEYTSVKARGNFYLATNDKPPYGLP